MIALVVEREWDTRESVRKKLERRGYIVHTAENAEEALNLCIIYDFDLVVAAAVLPEMSGFKLIERIRSGRDDLDLSAIVLVGKTDHSPDALKSSEFVPAMLSKPVLEEQLRACLPHDPPRSSEAVN